MNDQIIKKISKVDHKILNVNKKKEIFNFKLKITKNKIEHFGKANKENKVEPKFYLINAENLVLGRVSAKITNILKGKNKNTYTPNACAENFVIVTNCDKIKMTGNKMLHKVFYRHSGYRGGIKQKKTPEIMQKDSTELLRLAVKGMLASGPLFYKLLSTNLKMYKTSEHPHIAQNPELIDFKKLNKKNSI
jgi:large subunit ribosomal protein L13